MKALALRPLRDQVLIVLELNTGFRIAELLSLNLDQVWGNSAIRASIRVARAKMKGGRSRRRRSVIGRVVPVNAAVAAILKKYLATRYPDRPVPSHVPLFTSRLHRSRLSRWSANRIVHQVLRAAGFDDQDGYGTHSLRKRFANKIYQETSFDLNLTRAIMGHSDIRTTIAYLSIDADAMASAVMRIGERPMLGDGPDEADSSAA